MIKLLKMFRANESGATAIEYGLIAALIGASLISGVGLLANNLNSTFSYVSTKVSNGG